MELIYIWIGSFRNIKNGEVYFSNRFNVKYSKEERLLKVKKNQDYVSIKSKESNLVNISGIVGKNGVGKTNLLDLIGSRYVDRQSSDSKGDYFLLYYLEKEDTFILEGNHFEVLECLKKSEFINREYFEGRQWYRLKIACLSEELSYINDYSEHMDAYILSLREKWDGNHFDRKSLEELDESKVMIQRRQTEDQSRSLVPTVEMLEKQLSVPARKLFQNEYYELRILYNDFFVGYYEEYNQLDERFIGNLVEEQININKVLKAFVLYYFHRAMPVGSIEGDTNRKKIYDDMLQAVPYQQEEYKLYYWKLIEYIVNEVVPKRSQDERTKEHYEKQYNLFINALEDNDVFEYMDGEMDHFTQDSYLLLKIEMGFALVQYEQVIEATIDSDRLSEKAEAGNLFFDFFNHTISGLSNGEQTYLNLFAALNEQLRDILENTNHYIILMDEPDRNMHPELARNLVHHLDLFIQDGFKGTSKTFQLIISTHSPFILTDLLRENVVFLERKGKYTTLNQKNIATFGGHIQKLLIDDFFMDSTIGEYATNKIKEVIQWLSNGNIGRKEFEKASSYYEAIIQSVGDPIIKLKLERKFKEQKEFILGKKERNYKMLEELLERQTEELRLLREQLKKEDE